VEFKPQYHKTKRPFSLLSINLAPRTLRQEDQDFKAKAGGVTQVVECLLSKYEALSLNYSTSKKKTKYKNKKKHQPGQHSQTLYQKMKSSPTKKMKSLGWGCCSVVGCLPSLDSLPSTKILLIIKCLICVKYLDTTFGGGRV
jgi:hypothetical protein